MAQGFTHGLPIPVPVSQGGTGTTTSTGTGSVVLSNSPTLITPALGTPSALVLTNATGDQLGVTNGSAAAAGHVGEILQTAILAGAYTGAVDNIATLNLPAGAWLIFASILFGPTAGLAPGINSVSGTISLSPSTVGSGGDVGFMFRQQDYTGGGLLNNTMFAMKPFNFSATTPVYLTSQATSSIGIGFQCQMIAIRMR